jgi:hypothetical protein
MKPTFPSGQLKTTVGFEWMMGIAALVLSCGGVLDNWAHFHGLVDQSFFTPWHALMYGMMGTLGLVLGTLALINVHRGYHWRSSLPPGYLLSLTGVVIFVIAGLLDLGWHSIFGIEQATAAFVSPTHILLCAGGLLAGTGPFRAAWLTLDPSRSRGWLTLGPMVFSATAALIGLCIFTQFASPMNDMFAAKGSWQGGSDYAINTQSFGVAEIIVQTVLLMSMVLLLVRTWAMPFGAMTLLIGLPSITQLIMRDHYWLAAAVIGAGLIADIVLLRLHPPIAAANVLYLFAALVPAVYETLTFLVLGFTAGLCWSATLIVGSVLYAGITGLFIAFLLDWPIEARHDTNRGHLLYGQPHHLDRGGKHGVRNRPVAV